jgi:hypothetical protein
MLTSIRRRFRVQAHVGGRPRLEIIHIASQDRATRVGSLDNVAHVDADGGTASRKASGLAGDKPPGGGSKQRHGGVGGCIDSVGTVYKGLWKSLKGFMKVGNSKQVRDERT